MKWILKVKKEGAMFNLLHPKNTIEVSVFDSCLVVVVGIVVWFVSVLDVVVIIFSVVSIEFVSFLVRDVVSIALGIVVAISDKVWVSFTIVVSALLFCFFSSLQANSPSEFSEIEEGFVPLIVPEILNL